MDLTITEHPLPTYHPSGIPNQNTGKTQSSSHDTHKPDAAHKTEPHDYAHELYGADSAKKTEDAKTPFEKEQDRIKALTNISFQQNLQLAGTIGAGLGQRVSETNIPHVAGVNPTEKPEDKAPTDDYFDSAYNPDAYEERMAQKGIIEPDDYFDSVYNRDAYENRSLRRRGIDLSKETSI